MAAASEGKIGFSTGPQLFCRFAGARCGGLGARNPANPYYSVPFAPSFILFSPARGSGLGAKNPANPYYSVSFAPSFILFSPARGSGLGARNPANPYYSVPFAPSPAHFSLLRPAGARLPAARGAGEPRGYLYVYTKNLFYFVYTAYFLLHSTNS